MFSLLVLSVLVLVRLLVLVPVRVLVLVLCFVQVLVSVFVSVLALCLFLLLVLELVLGMVYFSCRGLIQIVLECCTFGGGPLPKRAQCATAATDHVYNVCISRFGSPIVLHDTALVGLCRQVVDMSHAEHMDTHALTLLANLCWLQPSDGCNAVTLSRGIAVSWYHGIVPLGHNLRDVI
jgi:hypothetical protein